jgi:predicted RNA-binding Zn ribbon-like protein
MSSSRPPILFVADSPGLDFLNTFAYPSSEGVEWLTNGDDLVTWLEQSKLLDAHTAAEMRATTVPGELDGVAAQARELREWFRTFVNRSQGSQLSKAARKQLGPLNALLERDEIYSSIEVREKVGSISRGLDNANALELVSKRRWRSPAALLFPIANALADVVCSANFAHIKRCEGHACTLFFLDKTKGHKRRWCSMAVCGNRAKQAAHRERAKQE